MLALRKSGEPKVAPVQAALINEGAVSPRDTLRQPGQTMQWQEQIKKMDLDGPGIVGYYLDLVSLMASVAPLYIGIREANGEIRRSDDPVLQMSMARYRGSLQSQGDLVAAHVRGRAGIGECWILQDPETGWNVVPKIQPIGTGQVRWWDLYGRERIADRKLVWRSHHPNPYDPFLAHSPLRRTIPDLVRLRNSVRNQNRSAASRLLTNGLLVFPPDPASAPGPYGGGNRTGEDDSGPVGANKTIADYLTFAKLAHRDDDSPAAMLPFPFEGVKPDFVDIGRDIDASALETERAAIEGFSRAVNFPQQLLTVGPGASNHWNEFLLQETAVKMFLAPQLEPVCSDILELFVLPTLEKLKQQLPQWEAPDLRRVVVDYDLSFLLRRPTNFSELFQAYTNGIATREEVADALGLGAPAPIPDGLSEYEHWQLATGKPGAPHVEVDMNGKVIVPDAPGAENPAGGEAPAQFDAGPMLAQALGGGDTAGTSMDVAEPEMPVIAALDTPEELSAFLEALGPADLRVSQRLEALFAEATTAVNSAVAAAFIGVAPAEEAARLSGLETDKVWASLSPGTRALIAPENVEDLILATLGPYMAEIEQILEDESSSFLEEWGPVIGAAVVAAILMWLASAALVGASALLWWFLRRYGKTPATVPAGLVLPPHYIARSVLVAAGGATVTNQNGQTVTNRAGSTIPPNPFDRDENGEIPRYTVVTDQQNHPVPADGSGAWSGNSGWFTGHAVITQVPTAVHWQWHHAFFRVPKTPDEEHKSFDGRVFARPTDVPNGRYVGDHLNDTCAMLPVLVPTS